MAPAESLESLNEKRKRSRQTHARETLRGTWQAICPRPGCGFTGGAASLSGALTEAVRHDHGRHSPL